MKPIEALSVVIPAYNEATRITRPLEALRAFLAAHVTDAEILVVDDGSTDATAAVVRAMPADRVPIRLIALPRNRGKGAAARAGLAEAAFPLVLLSDADLSTPMTSLGPLHAAVTAGADVAIGSRATAGARLLVRQPWWREGMGRTFNRVVRRTTGLPFHDTQCGFKLFRRTALPLLLAPSRIDGFAFDVELLLRARRAGLTVVEVPVEWHHDFQSRVRPVRHSLQMLRDLWRVRDLW